MSTSERFKLIPAVYLVLRKANQVLLLRRANTGYQDGNYSLVAGHIDGDELATSALIREAKEEANISLNLADLQLVHTAHRLNRDEMQQERIDLFFEATSWTGEITNMEPEKCDDLSWFDITHLPKNTIPFIANVLQDVQAGVVYSEYETEPS